MNRRDELSRQKLLDEKKANIGGRLRGVCADLPSREFDALVERMALVDIKYAKRRIEDDLPADAAPQSTPSPADPYEEERDAESRPP